MAPQGLSRLLGMEITPTATRPPASPCGGQDTDPAHDAEEPAVGARPRRTPQAWDRDQSGRCLQVHEPAPEAAIANLADIPSDPYEPSGVCRFLRRADCHIRSPWQNAYAERVIGTIRRECLDHVIVLSERYLRRILSSYFEYYHRSRTHLSLEKDCPELRPVHPPGAGKVIAFPQVGGLHHRYERLAA